MELVRVNLNRLDVNLLVVLDALLDEQSITKAASRLHLSTSATGRRVLIEVIQWHRYRDSDPARIWLHGMLKAALEPTAA
jgi:hypothetical protein